MAGINKLGFLNSLIEIVNNNMEEDAATSVLASISNTPANIANTEKPIPCIQNLYTLTPVSGI